MGNKFEVKSSGKATENKTADKELEKLREAKKKDQEKAKKIGGQQKEAEKKTTKKQSEKVKNTEKKIESAAAAVGAGIMAELADGTVSKKKKKTILLAVAAAVVVIAAGFLFFKPQILKLLGLNSASTSSGLLPDGTMGYNKIDFTNAVLGKAREEAKLIVLEQDVEVESKISNALANLAVFKKAKTIHSVGTGYYTVDLDGFSKDQVSVDTDKKIVTVTIPRTKLDHTLVDPEKTTFEKTDHAILGFGDVKLTQEQQNELDKSIEDAMKKVLDTDKLYKKADELACLKVRELLQPVVSAVSEDFVVEVIQ